MSLKEKIIDLVVYKGLNLNQVCKHFCTTPDNMYRILNRLNLRYDILKDRREKFLLQQLSKKPINEVADKYNATEYYLKRLLAIENNIKKSNKDKYFNWRWALKGWLGKYY